jgi:hypothetical protein
MKQFFNRNPRHRERQKGALTMFSAVLILILLTEMIFYAVQVGVFEQRKSSNEMNQKLAFHAADSAIQQAKQFMWANGRLAAAAKADGDWLFSGSQRWQPCSPDFMDVPSHPCSAESVEVLRAGTYFYSVDGDNELPLDPDALSPSVTERVTLHALLCMLEINPDDPVKVVQGCTTNTGDHDDRYYMITLAARGEADCNAGNCGAEALVSEKIGSFGPGGGEGGPGVPLTARTNVPLSGTVEIVPNPNGGGLGVPISSWVNANDDCPLGDDPISPESGSYATCERHEFYGVSEFPDDYLCPTPTCSCSKTEDRLISFVDGGDRIIGMDIVIDEDFPCDLWKYTFGYTKANYLQVKALVPKSNILTDCSTLDTDSVGFYWISGSTCTLQDQIGTKDSPVLLISATNRTRINAGANIFGTLFVTDVEDSDAEFTGNGRGTIFGAAIMDATMKNFNGTFQIVYVEGLGMDGLQRGGFGDVAGGWTDVHDTWQ